MKSAGKRSRIRFTAWTSTRVCTSFSAEIRIGHHLVTAYWTKLGARYVGIVQSLIVARRLHQIDPYDYLVDVLQLVGQHPASQVHLLTPRLWKQHFAAKPLRSALHNLPAKSTTP